MAIDGHRLQSTVVDNVYQWTPSPTCFYFSFCTSYDVLMYCESEHQVPTPFRKLRASTKICHINTPLRTRRILHDAGSSSGHPIAGQSPHTPTKLRASPTTGNTSIAPICGASCLRVQTTPWTIDTTMVYCVDNILATPSIDVHCRSNAFWYFKQ